MFLLFEAFKLLLKPRPPVFHLHTASIPYLLYLLLNLLSIKLVLRQQLSLVGDVLEELIPWNYQLLHLLPLLHNHRLHRLHLLLLLVQPLILHCQLLQMGNPLIDLLALNPNLILLLLNQLPQTVDLEFLAVQLCLPLVELLLLLLHSLLVLCPEGRLF